jgi:hypothetical protein
MARRFQLRGQSGPVANRIIELIEPEIIFGRDLSSDVVVSDSEVSRAHARLSWRDDTYVIEDLRSTNGTWVNGRPVLRGHKLAAGDTLTLGKVSVFVYEPVPEPVSDTTPNREPASLPELIESTMMMPALRKEIYDAAAAVMARRLERRAQPDHGEPGAHPAREGTLERPAEPALSPGASFYRSYLAALQSGDRARLLSLYHADAVLLSTDGAVVGVSAIAVFFERYLAGRAGFTAAPAGEPIEGGDSILGEAGIETADGVSRTRDAFVLKDGRATHHFTCVVETTPKGAGPAAQPGPPTPADAADSPSNPAP